MVNICVQTRITFSGTSEREEKLYRVKILNVWPPPVARADHPDECPVFAGPGDQGAPAVPGARVPASLVITRTQLTVTQHWGQQPALAPPVHGHPHILVTGSISVCHNSR